MWSSRLFEDIMASESVENESQANATEVSA